MAESKSTRNPALETSRTRRAPRPSKMLRTVSAFDVAGLRLLMRTVRSEMSCFTARPRCGTRLNGTRSAKRCLRRSAPVASRQARTARSSSTALLAGSLTTQLPRKRKRDVSSASAVTFSSPPSAASPPSASSRCPRTRRRSAKDASAGKPPTTTLTVRSGWIALTRSETVPCSWLGGTPSAHDSVWLRAWRGRRHPGAGQRWGTALGTGGPDDDDDD
mmetsp:Transcript_6764/g.22777  ORF Transcript_6764/g.22777 Transcript_6764/m.22777 type:complete len:218 (-) Transcript_6764:19-672(-)